MSHDQHDMFRDGLNALPLSAGRRGIAAMVLVEIVRWMPEKGSYCTMTPEELGALLNLQPEEIHSAMETLESLGVVEQAGQGASAQILLKPMKTGKSGEELRKEISAAIHSHTAWKRRLRHAIDTGAIEARVEDVARDDLCPFGKWLRGPTFSDAARSDHYETIHHLHVQFHRVAAATLQLALNGRKDEAEQSMSVTGMYAQASTRLTWALSSWRRTISS